MVYSINKQCSDQLENVLKSGSEGLLRMDSVKLWADEVRLKN